MNTKIKDALSKLDPANDNHWTADGLPRLETIRMLMSDQTVSRDMITQAVPGFTRTNAATSTDKAPEVVLAQADGKSADELEKAIVESQAKLDELKKTLQEAQAAYDAETAVQDELINEKHAYGTSDHTTDTIQGYLATQRADMEDRARRAKVLQESGVTLRDIQALVPQKSPLDQSLSKKR